MAVMTRSQFPRQLKQGLDLVWGLNYEPRKGEWESFCSRHTSDDAFVDEVLVSGLGGAVQKGEGEAIRYDSTNEAWSYRYNHLTIALGISFTQEAIEDNKYIKVGPEMVKQLAASFVYTKEILGASLLNNGFSSSFLGGDGKALFATDHPLAGGGTYANKPTTDADLSEEVLEDALIAIDGFVDERGKPSIATADGLIIPRQYKYIATRILKNSDRPGTANRDINAMVKNGDIPGGMSINHYISDPDSWYLVNKGNEITDNGLKYFERTKLESVSEPEFETGNVRYKKRERYSFGWTNPRGAYGSQGG